MAKPYDYQVKLLLVGDSSVGKTSLLLRFTDHQFQPDFISTIGVDFKTRTFQINDKAIRLQIWDTAGQERFRTITSSYYRGVDGIILVYDVTNSFSFTNIRSWIDEIERYAPQQSILVLVATKTDLTGKRTVSLEEGEALAQELGVPYIEASSKLDQNVDEIFRSIAQKIYQKMIQEKPTPFVIHRPITITPKDPAQKQHRKCPC